MESPLCRIIPALLLIGVLSAGCNVFDGLYEEGTSKDVEVLLADAAIAFQKGQYEKAVKILESAHAANPNHPAVRVDLSNALLRKHNVSVLDIVVVAENINGKLVTGGFGKSAGAACSFPSTATILGEFDYTDVEGYAKLLSNRETFTRIAELLRPVLPPSLHQLTLSDDYDREALVNSILASGLTVSRVDAMLMAYAASVLIDSYLFIFQDDADVTWYRVRGEIGNEYIGYCAASEAARELVEQRAVCSVRRLGTAVIALDLRATHLKNAEAAREVVEEARDAYEKLEAELANHDISCE